MGRLGLFFCTAIAGWALVIMPALCEGGVLLHPCHCGHIEECGHEAECATDPCGMVVTRPNNTQDVTLDLHSGEVLSPLPITVIDPRVVPPISWCSPTSYLRLAGLFDALASTILLI